MRSPRCSNEDSLVLVYHRQNLHYARNRVPSKGVAIFPLSLSMVMGSQYLLQAINIVARHRNLGLQVHLLILAIHKVKLKSSKN